MPAADGITFDAHRARYSLAASGGGSHPTDERMRTFPRTAPGEDIIPDRLGGQNRWPLTGISRARFVRDNPTEVCYVAATEQLAGGCAMRLPIRCTLLPNRWITGTVGALAVLLSAESDRVATAQIILPTGPLPTFMIAPTRTVTPAPPTPTRTVTPAPPTRTATPAPPTRTVTPAPTPLVNVSVVTVPLDIALFDDETGEDVSVVGDLQPADEAYATLERELRRLEPELAAVAHADRSTNVG